MIRTTFFSNLKTSMIQDTSSHTFVWIQHTHDKPFWQFRKEHSLLFEHLSNQVISKRGLFTGMRCQAIC